MEPTDLIIGQHKIEAKQQDWPEILNWLIDQEDIKYKTRDDARKEYRFIAHSWQAHVYHEGTRHYLNNASSEMRYSKSPTFEVTFSNEDLLTAFQLRWSHAT